MTTQENAFSACQDRSVCPPPSNKVTVLPAFPFSTVTSMAPWVELGPKFRAIPAAPAATRVPPLITASAP